MNNGWTHADPVLATKEVIAPVTGGLIGMIFLPGLVFRLVQSYILPFALDDVFICECFCALPLCFDCGV
jgi:E3 ubiquitin-protein ligase MARCH6